MEISRAFEQYRVQDGPIPSNPNELYGLFMIPLEERHEMYHNTNNQVKLAVIIVSNSPRWEHCSISLLHRYPSWGDMMMVKENIWTPEDTVVQFHPKEDDYVNINPYMLHLWMNTLYEYELPDLSAVYGTKRYKNERTDSGD